MLYGAYLSGAALTGGFAIQHAIAHMLGGSYGVEHGTAHAVVLPYVTDHLVKRAPQALGRIADAVGTGIWPAICGIWPLARASRAAGRRRVLGRDEDPRAVLIATTADAPPSGPDIHDAGRAGNPAPVTEAAVRSILRAAAAGRRPGGRR